MSADYTLEDVIEAHLKGAIAQIHTMLPAKVVSFDDTGAIPRATVRLAVKFNRLKAGGAREETEFYEAMGNGILADLPVQYLVAGGVSIYFPLAVGDEVLVDFAERDIDNAVDEGADLNDPGSARRHALADGIVRPMAWSSSVPADARDSALVIEAGVVKLGKSATEFATTASKVYTRLLAIETFLATWAPGHTHTGVAAGAFSTGTAAAAGLPSTSLASLKADKVKIE